MLDQLQGNNNMVYVVMFHAGDDRGEEVTSRTEEYKAAINAMTEHYPAFTYAFVDASNPSYADLVTAVSLNRNELNESPTLMIMHLGNGAWMHGPQAISKLVEFAPVYEKEMQ